MVQLKSSAKSPILNQNDPLALLDSEYKRLQQMAERITRASQYPEEQHITSKYLIGRAWQRLKRFASTGIKIFSGQNNTISTWLGTERRDRTQDKFNREYNERYVRETEILSTRKMLGTNPLLYAAWKKYTDGALGTGFSVIVQLAIPDPMLQAKCQRHINRMISRCELNKKSPSWARWLVADGDLFLQPKLQLNQMGEFDIVAVKKMPAESMVRLTDDQEEFIDVHKAFGQKDISRDTYIDFFPLWQILHVRYDYEDGQRYGNSIFFPVKYLANEALKATKALGDRRKATKPLLVHKLKGKDGLPLPQTQFDKYVEGTSMKLKAERGEYSEYSELYCNGGDADAITMDGTLGEVGDIAFLYDVCLSPTGVGRQLLGSEIKQQRDVLDEVRGELYAAQRQLMDLFAIDVYKELFDLELMLKGIDPRLVTYNFLFKQRYTESALERRIDRALRSKAAGCLSPEDVMAVQADYFDINDINAALRRISFNAPPGQVNSQTSPNMTMNMSGASAVAQPPIQTHNRNFSDVPLALPMGLRVMPLSSGEANFNNSINRTISNSNFYKYGLNPDLLKKPSVNGVNGEAL